MSDGKRVLVTGAGGYIGAVLTPMLLEAGYAVRALDRFFFGRELLADHDRLEVVVEDNRRLTAAHFEGVEAVIDLAALSNDPTGELFQAATREINCAARVNAARLAKQAGAKRYVLPSSCSIYGFQPHDAPAADETSPTNPLTTYARANEEAEQGALALADNQFCVVALRQATVYGLSPRMRFDLAINGMTYGAWKTGKLPVMRDGSQWRPMIHVRDAAAAQLFMLEADPARVNGQIFNVGSAADTCQISPLAELIAAQVARHIPDQVALEWYGDPDQRSYRVSFDKIEALGWRARETLGEGVAEICAALKAGRIDKTLQTITLEWYKALTHWHGVVRKVEMHGGILEI